MFKFFNSISERFELYHLRKVRKSDFDTDKSKHYHKFIAELKEDILLCGKSFETQKQDAENIIKENKDYAPSTTGTVISVVVMITGFLISVFSLKIFENINPILSILVLVLFQIIALRLLSSALQYKRRETSYYKIKLQCINELIDEQKSDKPKIILDGSRETNRKD